MQFSSILLTAAAIVAVKAETSYVTATDLSTTEVTITSCASEVTNCPAKKNATSTSASNVTNGSSPSVTSYEGAANGINGQFAAAGLAALVAGALLGL